MKKNRLFLNIMHLYFIFFFLHDVLAETKNLYNAIRYRIRPDIHQKILYINAKYYGNFQNSEIIDLPYKWSDKDYSTQIKNIYVLAGARKKLYFNNNKYNQLTIGLPVKVNVIEINYEVHLPSTGNTFDLKNPIIYKDLIYTLGHAVFALPSDLEPTKKLNISVLWNTIPESRQILSSHGMGAKQNFYSNSLQLLNSVFTLGKTRNYKTVINNKYTYFSLYGSFDFKDREFVKNACKIIKSQRKFFNDYNFDNYLVTVIENPDGNEKLALMGGIALHNSFVVYLSKGINQTQYKLLFAHEHLHNWIGGTIRNSEEELNYWWSEGFTDYYARVLSTRHGVLSLDDFITEANDILKEYYASPVINASNEQIKKEFRNNYNIYRLAYLRGFVFAIGLNCKIKSAKKNLSSDDVLKYFQKEHKNINFSNKNFIEAIKNLNIYTSEINDYFNNSIIEGKIISLDDCLCHLPMYRFRH